MTENKLKPCPFCGLQSDVDWDDTLYPSGSGWREDPCGTEGRYLRHYLGANERHRWQGTCYQINCAEIYGGCGVNITGDSKQEVIDKWNYRLSEILGE